MGKAKKRKNEDFHKPKLKVGKRKPVGSNVTKTTFKTTAINLSTQLELTNEPHTKKNLTLKDLLSHLNHYNGTVRHEACLGLRDLFQSHPEILHEQIGTWIYKVFGKIVDVEGNVRRSLHTCVQYIINGLDDDEIYPFMHIIIAHICCGLTHINESIQFDALSLLELILESFPKLLMNYGFKLLPSLTDLICKNEKKETKLSQTHTLSKSYRGISSIVTRDVSINVEGQMSSLKSKTMVLEKVYKILNIFFIDTHENHSDCSAREEEMNAQLTEQNQTYERIFPSFRRCAPGKTFDEWIFHGDHREVNKEYFHASEFLHSIYPVLLNSWIEFEPAQLSSGFSDSSSIRASIPGMWNIVSIFDIFVRLAEKDSDFVIFRDMVQFKDFCTHFLNFFSLPLSFTKQRVKSIAKQETTSSFQKFAIEFNFVMAKILCHVLSQDYILWDNKQKYRYLKQINVFCVDMLENSGFLSKDKIRNFIGIFKSIMRLKNRLKDKEVELIDTQLILQKMTQCYSRGSVTSPWKIPLLEFFTSFCSERNPAQFEDEILIEIRHLIKIVICNMWSIPASSSSLITASMKFVKIVTTYRFCTDGLKKSLEESMISMTDLHKGLYQHFDTQSFEGMVQIIYSLTKLPKELLKNAAILCHQPTITIENRKYLISTISLSMQKFPRAFELEEYISFLLTVLIGYESTELNRMNSENRGTVVSWNPLHLYNDEPKEMPTEYIIDQLKLLDNHSHYWTKLMSPIGKFLTMNRKLPLSTAFGIVKLLNKLSEWDQEKKVVETLTPNPAINPMADLLSAILLHCISERYNKLHGSEGENVLMINNIVSATITLLSNKPSLFRQVMKKWTHNMKEFTMDPSCVTSIAEVLLVLLQEPALYATLRKMKLELLSIINEQMKSPATLDKISSLKQHLNFVFDGNW